MIRSADLHRNQPTWGNFGDLCTPASGSATEHLCFRWISGALANVWKMQTSEHLFWWHAKHFTLVVEWPGQWCSGHCPVSRSQRRPGTKDIHCNDFGGNSFKMQLHLKNHWHHHPSTIDDIWIWILCHYLSNVVADSFHFGPDLQVAFFRIPASTWFLDDIFIAKSSFWWPKDHKNHV